MTSSKALSVQQFSILSEEAANYLKDAVFVSIDLPTEGKPREREKMNEAAAVRQNVQRAKALRVPNQICMTKGVSIIPRQKINQLEQLRRGHTTS